MMADDIKETNQEQNLYDNDEWSANLKKLIRNTAYYSALITKAFIEKSAILSKYCLSLAIRAISALLKSSAHHLKNAATTLSDNLTTLGNHVKERWHLYNTQGIPATSMANTMNAAAREMADEKIPINTNMDSSKYSNARISAEFHQLMANNIEYLLALKQEKKANPTTYNIKNYTLAKEAVKKAHTILAKANAHIKNHTLSEDEICGKQQCAIIGYQQKIKAYAKDEKYQSLHIEPTWKRWAKAALTFIFPPYAIAKAIETKIKNNTFNYANCSFIKFCSKQTHQNHNLQQDLFNMEPQLKRIGCRV